MCPEAQRGPGTVLEPHREAGLRDPVSHHLCCTCFLREARLPTHPCLPMSWHNAEGSDFSCSVCYVHSPQGLYLVRQTTESAVVVV